MQHDATLQSFEAALVSQQCPHSHIIVVFGLILRPHCEVRVRSAKIGKSMIY